HGFLPDAIRASMALPSVFAPVELGGAVLIDGGVVRNLPAQDARALGADVLICSDVTDPLEPRDSIVSLVDVLAQAVSFRVWDSERAERGACDVLIVPDVRAFTSFGFGRAAELMARGAAAGVAALPARAGRADAVDHRALRRPLRAGAALRQPLQGLGAAHRRARWGGAGRPAGPTDPRGARRRAGPGGRAERLTRRAPRVRARAGGPVPGRSPRGRSAGGSGRDQRVGVSSTGQDGGRRAAGEGRTRALGGGSRGSGLRAEQADGRHGDGRGRRGYVRHWRCSQARGGDS